MCLPGTCACIIPMQRSNSSILSSKQGSSTSYIAGPFHRCREAWPGGLKSVEGNRPLVKPYFPNATATVLTKVAFESKDGSTNVLKVTRFFYAQDFPLQKHNMDILKRTYLLSVVGDRNASLLSLLLFGIASTVGGGLQLAQRENTAAYDPF